MNEPAEMHDEVAIEQANLDVLYARLDAVRDATRERLARTLRAETPDTPNGLSDRDAQAALYEEQLADLDRVDERLSFGRLDLSDGSRLYIGRIGLADEHNQPMLVDWRAPIAAVFYQATAAAPGDVVRRRHLTTHGRKVVSVEDEVLDMAAMDPSEQRHLVGEGALMAAVQAARTGRMGDIVATIQAEQDRIIRDDLSGVLVVQGGPGTGKTVVALHRTAYLLYTHRSQLSRSGVLLVGPSPVFLRYIERVLPSLGETGVVMRTIGTMFPGVKTEDEDPPAVARVKGSPAMHAVIERAVRKRQVVPKAPVTLRVDDQKITVAPDAFRDARRRARGSGLAHNAARPMFVRHMYDHLAGLLSTASEYGMRLTPEDRREVIDDLLASDDVRRTVRHAWPPLTATDVLADLYADPELLATAAGKHLSADDRALLRRAPETARRWTIADVPLLDEVADLLGVDDTLDRMKARQAAERRREEVAYAQESLQLTGGQAAARVSAEYLADRFGDGGRTRTVAERAGQDRSWSFGHIVVDEAQELSAMAWRMLMRRGPSRSMTLVGDIAQTGSAAGADAWSEVLSPYVANRWRLADLTINYRTPTAIMDLAAAVLRAAGIAAEPPTSVRDGETPTARHLPTGDPQAALAALVAIVREQHVGLGDRRLAVIAPTEGTWAVGRIAAALESALPSGVVGQGSTAVDAPVAVLDPRQSKGLEVDIVVLVEPAAILGGSPRGANDLYVAITRPTQRLIVAFEQPLPAGMQGIAAATQSALGNGSGA